jgi:RNA recognition motif-containing protein
MASNTLFVSNFPFTTTEEDLGAIFTNHGLVKSVRIIVDRETGRSRGFAFVEFDQETAVDAAIDSLNNSDFRGRRLIVSKARGRAAGAPTAPVRASNADAGPTNRSASVPFRYRIVIEWDDAENVYTAAVPTLGVHAQGASIDAAIRKAQSLSYEQIERDGDTLPQPDL